MLQAALQAIGRGFWIFPSAPGDKVPHRLAGSWGETATNDPNRVINFWTKVDPQANPCIACKPSQLLVVDLDQAKEDANLRGTDWEYMHGAYGARVNGIDLIDEMAYKLSDSEDFSLDFNTYTVLTGSGGRHLYYRWPEHWPRISQASPVKGVIDVRGNGGQWGGYVLGEGSVTAAGPYKRYFHGDIGLPPPWIRLLVAEKPKAPKIQRPQGLQQPGVISYAGLVESVRNAGEGNRNNALLWASRAMYSDGATLEVAKDTLGPAASQAGLGDLEIERTIESGYRAQQQKEG